MECRRCGDAYDLEWGNQTYCGQCIHDQSEYTNQAFSAHQGFLGDEVEEGLDEALRAYVPRQYRTPFSEEY